MLACNLDSGIVIAMVDMCTNPDKKLFLRHMLINIATSAFIHRAHQKVIIQEHSKGDVILQYKYDNEKI
jgi:hypothetical protein